MSEEPDARRWRWDDLRVFLAAHRAQTLLGAAKALGTHPSTVGRRIEAFEEELGHALFDRTTTGLLPTALADALRPIAETMESQVGEALRLLESQETEPEGWVRLTAPPGIATYLVAPLLVRLREQHPGIRIELLPSVGYADLTRREAELALRSVPPSSGDLLSVRLAEEEMMPFVSAELDLRLGSVRSLEEVAWLSWDESLAHLPDAVWLRRAAPDAPIALRCASYEPLIEAARAGLGAVMTGERFGYGVGLVPLRMHHSFRRSLPERPRGALYLVGHRALREVPRVAAVWRFLVEQIASEGGK